MGTLRVFEAFAGYGSQSMALKRLAVDYEVVGISEIDKYAIQAYNAVHGDTRNYGDICKIDWKSVPDFDLFTYSFPCQDISSAGKQRGFEEGSGTRSSLLWECKRAIIEKRPKYLLMENVKAITQKKFMPYLETWIDMLSFLGYSSFLKVLNAKDYGVPQNRERAFVVSILGEDEHYEFPKSFVLDKRLKDLIESSVDDKYYLSQRFIDTLEKHKERMRKRGNGFGFEPTTGDGVASSVLTTAGSRPCDNYVYDIENATTCAMCGRDPNNPTSRKSGVPTKQILEFGGEISNCITTIQKDALVALPAVLTPKRTEYGKHIRAAYERGEIKERRNAITQLEPRTDGVSNTITTVQKDNLLVNNLKIRKLTERECFRLMGVSDSDIDKIQAAGISRTQQYKLAGNSIVVNVLCKIFYEMLKDTDYLIDILA